MTPRRTKSSDDRSAIKVVDHHFDENGEYQNPHYKKILEKYELDIDDSKFIKARAIEDKVMMPTKQFFVHLINHCRLREDSQYNEYIDFINNLDTFVKQTIVVVRKTQKYKMIIGLRDVVVSGEMGEYQFLDNAKYNIQSQAPSKTLHYDVVATLFMKIYKLQGSLGDTKLLLDENLTQINFGIPKMNTALEDNDFGENINTLLGNNLDTLNYFALGGLKHKIGQEENMPKNIFQIREPKKGNFVGDIISVRPGLTMSTYMKVNMNVEKFQLEISTNIPKMRQGISLSLRAFAMLFGFFTPASMAEYLVLPNDPMYHAVIDLFNKFWDAQHDKHLIDLTRRAENLPELQNAVKQQIVVKEKLASFNKFENSSFCEVMIEGILPHVVADEHKDSIMKVVYFCRYLCDMLKCVLGNKYTTDRYSYKGKVLRSPTMQVKKSAQTAIDKYVRTMITPVWSDEFFTSIIDANDKPIMERLKTLKAQMSRPLEKSKSAIFTDIVMQIRIGLLSSQQKGVTKGVQTGNREVNSRIAESKNPFRIEQTDRFVYIKGGSSNASEHDATKRKPHPTSREVFDHRYATDAGRVGLIHELSSTTIISPDPLEETVQNVRESLSMFDIEPMGYIEDYIEHVIDRVKFNGLYIGFVEDGCALFKKILKARAEQKISRYLSVKYDPIYCEVQLNTNPGKMMFPAITINKDDGTTKFAKHEALGFDDPEMTKPISIPRMFEEQKLVWLHSEETNSLVISMDMNELIGYEYFVHQYMNMSFANLQYKAAQGEGTRTAMTLNQLRQNVGCVSEYTSLSNDKAQSHLVVSEETNYACTVKPGKPNVGMNVLCALHMGNGDTNNDSSEISSEVAANCGIINKLFKMTYKAEHGQIFINPNMFKQRGWQNKYRKLNNQGYAKIGAIIEPGDIICVISDSVSERIIEKTYTGNNVGRVKEGFKEYNGNIGSVTIVIEFTLVFKSGDKIYMPNACKSVVKVVDANRCYKTLQGRIVGANYSSLSVLKRLNSVPGKCIIFQSLLNEDPDADCSEKVDFGDEITYDLIDYIGKYIKDGRFLGYEYLINPLTGVKTTKKVALFEYSMYRNIHVASEKQHIKGDQDNEKRLDPKSQQSISGKGSNGGLRSGNLIRYAVISGGAVEVMTTLFIQNSDGRRYPICKSCGTNLSVVMREDAMLMQVCNMCGPFAEISVFDSTFSSNKVRSVALHGRQVNTELVFAVDGQTNGLSVDYIIDNVELK